MTGPACCDAAIHCQQCDTPDCLDTNATICPLCGLALCESCGMNHDNCAGEPPC